MNAGMTLARRSDEGIEEVALSSGYLMLRRLDLGTIYYMAKRCRLLFTSESDGDGERGHRC